MRLPEWLPRVTLLGALVVWTLTLIVTVASGVGLGQPGTILVILALAGAFGLILLAQNPGLENAALLFWVAAGIWGAAAYLNFQMLGILDLAVGILAAATAFVLERDRRAFSFNGPLLFIASGLILVLVANYLSL